MARWSPLGIKIKISDEHPRLFHVGVSPRDLYFSIDFQCLGCLAVEGKRDYGEERQKKKRITLTTFSFFPFPAQTTILPRESNMAALSTDIH